MCQEANYGHEFSGHYEQCGCGYSGYHLAREKLPYQMCCHSGSGLRRFISREEIIAQLEQYLKELQSETRGVEERITEFKKTA